MTASTDRTRWAALLVLCVGMLMIVLDATIVNVALVAVAVVIVLTVMRPASGAAPQPVEAEPAEAAA